METVATIIPKLRTVIFDFDGTLATVNVDFTAMRAGLLEIVHSSGLSPKPFEGLFALEMTAAAEESLAALDPERAALFHEEAHTFIRRTEVAGALRGRVFDDVPFLFEDLKKRRIATAVVTRNCRDAVLTLYPDIEEHVDVVVTRHDVDRVKPHPDHLRAALERVGRDPASALMVGDHPMDIAAGKAAGTFTAGVLTGLASRQALLAAGSDFVFDHVGILARIITDGSGREGRGTSNGTPPL